MTDRSRLRLVVLSVLVISLVGTLIGRLWYLQVLAAPQFRADALQNQTKEIVTEAPRGEVVDDEGRPLIDNKTALVISVDRNTLLGQADDGKAVLTRLAALLHTSAQKLILETRLCGKASDGTTVSAPCWGGSPYQPIPVSHLKPSTASTDLAFEIDEQQEKFPGVIAEPEAVRNYPMPDGALASSILGYTSPISAAALDKLKPAQQAIQRSTQVGVTGLEASYEKYLHGTQGLKTVAVDHLGSVISTVKTTAPVAGDDVVTNLDAKAQAALELQLHNALTYAHSKGDVGDYAAGVVLNVNTGGVIAMGSEPTYKPTQAPPTLTTAQYTKREHEGANLFIDKAYQSMAPPGSTFKLISSSGLLADGTVSQGQTTDCLPSFDGKINFDGESFGAQTLAQAIIASCDTVFYQLANADWNRDNNLVKAGKTPVEGVQKMARAYGISKPVGLDIPGAAEGAIGDRQTAKVLWKEIKSQYCKGAKDPTHSALRREADKEYCDTGYIFEPGDQMNEDIGQGTVLASPLQMAVAYAAMANGGTVYEPRIAKAIMSPTGALVKRINPVVRDHLPISASNLDYIRNAMYGVITDTHGTAKSAFAGFPLGQVKVGGKTGTAELSGTNEDGSWFASFAGPAGGAPQYVAVIEVDKSEQGAQGAAPFVKNMWESIYGLKGQKAIFPNGVAPTKLPKVGAAAARERAALAQERAKLKRNKTPNATGSASPSTSGSPSGSPSDSPSTPSNAPSSPSTNAAALPFALPVSLRSWAPQ